MSLTLGPASPRLLQPPAVGEAWGNWGTARQAEALGAFKGCRGSVSSPLRGMPPPFCVPRGHARVSQSPGPPPHTRGSRSPPRAAETLRRAGAARSHLPLIEFICYNPKQCKAGFSQAPAACLPIKIPSRTANPPLPPWYKTAGQQAAAREVSLRASRPPGPHPTPPRSAARGAPSPLPGGSGGNEGPAGTPKAPGSEQARCPGAHRCGIRAWVGWAPSCPQAFSSRDGIRPCRWGYSPPAPSLGTPNRLPSCRALHPVPRGVGHHAVTVPAAAGATRVPVRGTAGVAGGQWDGAAGSRAGGGGGDDPTTACPAPCSCGMGVWGWGSSDRSPDPWETLGGPGSSKSSSAPGRGRHRVGLHWPSHHFSKDGDAISPSARHQRESPGWKLMVADGKRMENLGNRWWPERKTT